MSGCASDCSDRPDFPRVIFNRAGLDAIDYRIGDYASMRAAILAAIDSAPELAAWTHRRPDDPGIALAEASAIVADILALYQQTYANEAYVRTASWRESVVELVRVLGYRLAPGLGGRARFAIAVKGGQPVLLPRGFAITAKLPSAPKPAQFETTEAFTAHPALSKFRLYRPRYVPLITNGLDTFQLDAGNDIALSKGDRLLVGTVNGTTLFHTQIVVVDKVWESFGVRHVKTQGRISSLSHLAAAFIPAPAFSVATAFLSAPVLMSSVTRAPMSFTAGSFSMPVGLLTSGISFLPAYSGALKAGLAKSLLGSVPEMRAYKLGPSARHFGHSAPPTRVAVDAGGHATEIGMTFSRRLGGNQGDPAAPSLQPTQWPLDGEPSGFAAGVKVLVEANFSDSDGGVATKRVVERNVTQIDRQSLAWGVATGASTVLNLDASLVLKEGGAPLAWTDIRGVTLHAVQGDAFRIRAQSRATAIASGHMLSYFGAHDDAMALVDRNLLLAGMGAPRAVQVQAVTAGAASDDPQFHTVALDTDLPLDRFPYDAPVVDVYGNLVETTEGKTEINAPLGDGDAREVFQTFAVPKLPLTYLLDTGAQPPQLPELEVRVGGVLWQRVPSFLSHRPREAIYIVRESGDGVSSYVQFGDGRTGARLPSGKANIVAHWRTGNGAHGLPAGSDKPQAAKRLPNFDDVWMLEPATGGAVPESASNARRAAPATMQSLGRIVSLADLEAEALMLPGVLKARAVWQATGGTPAVALTVLLASGEVADATAIDLALRHALAARGPARWALLVRHGKRRRVTIDLTVAFDPALRNEDIALAIKAALGIEDDDPADDLDLGERGLMHWRSREFGEAVHGSQIVGATQSVPGVRWVELNAFALSATLLPQLALHSASSAMTGLVAAPLLVPLLPGLFHLRTPPVQRNLRAAADELLSLAPDGLQIRFVADTEAGR